VSGAAFEECVRDGGVALFPADTLYGLACDPSNEAAIARIHALKGRDEGRPSAVMFFAPLELREVLSISGPRTRGAIGALLPGPVTLVVDNPRGLYPLACRDDPRRLGIRLIAGEGPLEGARCAVFQTSANRSGEPAPVRFGDVDPGIVAGADLAIDGGELGGEPSTVVDLSGFESGEWTILRQGALSEAEVGERLGRLSEPASRSRGGGTPGAA
jgi:L-threonylcarbamoyladenylate synthase